MKCILKQICPEKIYMVGSGDFLTPTIKMRVRPEPECEEEPISGGSLTTPTVPQMTDVTPNRCGNRTAFQGREEVRRP